MGLPGRLNTSFPRHAAHLQRLLNALHVHPTEQGSSDGFLPASSTGGFVGSYSDLGRFASSLAQASTTISRPGLAEARVTGSFTSDSSKTTVSSKGTPCSI